MINEITKNKWILCVLLAIAIVTALWLFMPGNDGQEAGLQAGQQAAAEEHTEEDGKNAAADNVEPGYYFVKAAEGAVNVYWYEGDEKTLYQETNIEFSLLSAEDQELLETGIRLDTDQELAGFLENFDS